MNNRILNDVWIDLSFFKDVDIFGNIINLERTNPLKEAYIIWEEANNTISESSQNKEKLNQGFLSLKRAFNVASIELKKNTGIDEIQYQGKKSNDYLSVLEHFEIVKTLTLKKYLKIRNLIEHQNVGTPSGEEALILSEYIWNYIRNVSNVLKNFNDNLYISGPYGEADFSYEISEEKGKYIPSLNVKMVVNKKYISFIEKLGFLKINNIHILTKAMEEEIDEIFSSEIESRRNSLQYFIFIGEIVNPDLLVAYIKNMVLPEYEGINEETIYKLFE